MTMKPTEYRCTVESFNRITPTVFEISFQTDQPLTFAAGQFVSVIIPGAGPRGRDLRRAYSIASPPEKKPIELCIKLVEGGPGTTYLHSLKPGHEFRVVAPYGDFLYRPKAGFQACFIATGTGIAPFRSMILSQQFKDNPPTKALCMLGVRSESELLYTNELNSLSKLEFIQAVSQPEGAWKGFHGRVTQYLKNMDSDFPWTQTEYYLCGHGGMINEVKAFLTERNVPKESIHQEVYYK